MPKIYTIGFSKKNAQTFFSLLENTTANKLIDIRLNNVSQLAGFTKANDLPFFLKRILGWDYIYKPELAPTKELLSDFQKKKIKWNEYEVIFNDLLEKRNIKNTIKKDDVIDGVLLCSEEKPDFCHRRLVAEYIKKQWNDIEIVHLF